MFSIATYQKMASRLLEGYGSDEFGDWLMEEGRALYIFYSASSRNWPDTLRAAEDLRVATTLEKERYEHWRQATLKLLDKSMVKDRPRPFPFRGALIKNILSSFKRWRAKRAYQRYEDWVRVRAEIPTIFSQTYSHR